MRVAFVGKGGSGKTTLTSLFARLLASKNVPVLAIDADINQHLAESVGLKDIQIPTMSDQADLIKDHLKGSNKLIESISMMMKTTPPGKGSQLLKVKQKNTLYQNASLDYGQVKLMAVGALSEEDLGVACFHGKTGVLELMLSHMDDDQDEFVLVDMTAGADSFASGIFAKFDMTFLIVEPTTKGLVVYQQYKEYSKGYDVPLKVIGNKVFDSDDKKFLEQNIGEDLLGVIGHSSFIKKQEKGAILPISELESENLEVLKKMQQLLEKTTQDRDKHYQYTVDFHLLNASEWMNDRFQYDFTKQVDPGFTWPKA